MLHVSRDEVAMTRRRWKRPRLPIDFLSVNTTHSAGQTIVLPARTVSNNQTSYRRLPSWSKAVVRSISDHKSGREGVLSVAGLPAQSHPHASIQRLVDGMLIAMLGIFVVVIVAAVTLARRRRRAVAAACDDYIDNDDDDDNDCVELDEFVTELTDHDDSPHGTTLRAVDWGEQGDREDDDAVDRVPADDVQRTS